MGNIVTDFNKLMQDAQNHYDQIGMGDAYRQGVNDCHNADVQKAINFLCDLYDYIEEEFVPYGNGDKVLTMDYDRMINDFKNYMN